MSRDGQYRTEINDRVGDPDVGFAYVEKVWRGEDIGRFTDGSWFRGTHASACMGRGWQRSLTQVENAETARRR